MENGLTKEQQEFTEFLQFAKLFQVWQQFRAETPAPVLPVPGEPIAKGRIDFDSPERGYVSTYNRKGILALADHDPDRRRVRNNSGFSRVTGPKGHKLARKIRNLEPLSPEEAEDARWICYRHRKQIRRLLGY